MRNTLRVFGLFVWKDLYAEFRARQFIVSSTGFGVLLLLILGMALDAISRPPVNLASGLIWLVLFFSISIQMNRHDYKDLEMGAGQGMFLVPIDRSLLFYAKWTSTSLFVFVMEIVLVPIFFVILNETAPTLPMRFVLVMVVGSIGLTGIGTFLATLAQASSMRDMLLPFLMFPLTIPLFLALIHLTTYTFSPALQSPVVWVDVLIGYIAITTVLPWLLFETLMEV